MDLRFRTSLRVVLRILAIAAMVVLVLRAGIGPFQVWGNRLPIHSPFSMESAFWIAICGLLLTQRERNAISRTNASARFRRIALAICLCLIALAFAGNLSDPFLSDDYILVSRAQSIGRAALLATFCAPGGDGAFRPLGALYYHLVAMWAGFNPLKWHLCALALHLLNSALVFSVATRLWRDITASASAALIFGLNATRPEVVIWTAGNFDLLACFFVLAAINVALIERIPRRTPVVACALLLVAAGVLCKESAYVAPVFALGLLLSNRCRRDLRPFVTGSVGVCVALFAYRWWLFHGPGGYLDSRTGRPAILSLAVLPALKGVLLRMWTVLLLPLNWDAPTSPFVALALLAIMTSFLLLSATMATGIQHEKRVRIGLIVATICAALPAIHLVLIGQSGLGSRVLYLPGVPFALLVASLFLFSSRHRLAVLFLLLLGYLGILEHNLGTWRRAAARAQQLCSAVAMQPAAILEPEVPATLDGVWFFANGFPECVAVHRSVAAAQERVR